jgi:diacylglycerol O-acyltransferase / wax synthase
VDQLTTLDAGFLQVEDSDKHVSLAIGGLAILEGPAPRHEALAATLGQRIGACPRFRQRLRVHPLDLGAPEWVDDPEFDLSHHLRRIAVRRPGSDQELFELVAELMSWRLDRSRPLWEIWVIEGLTDDRWALLMKVHHCIADGIATAHMLMGLSDRGVGNSFAGRVCANKEPEPPKLRPAGLVGDPRTWINRLRSTSAAVTSALGLLRPTSSLNGNITNLRRYTAARVSLDDVRQVCRAFDVTINDVALAAVTESYRALLSRRGEQPSPDSLRTLVPMSIRSVDALESTDNRVSTMLPHLPVDVENPIHRLRVVHRRLTQTKSHGQTGSSFASVADSMPFAVTAWAMRLLTRLPQRVVTTLATNVPGPREPLQIMGCKVTDVMPVPPIAMQLRSAIAILSYADDLFFGILADFDAMPDIDELARGIEAAVARLVAISKRRKPARDHRGLSLVVSA